MKFLVALTISFILAATFMLSPVGGAPGVTYLDHDKVAAAIGKGGTLVTAPDLTVMGSHRDAAGRVEVHDKETDVIYMIDGQATFVTGGTVVGLTQSKPGQSLGSEIKDGETHHLSKGDVIVVPAGVPHWFKEVQPSVSYFVVKVIKQ
jgi:mannose-6-phosphate isomerase-like protein (cupin superfamily)